LSQLDWKGIEHQIYKCARCRTRFNGEQLIMRDRIVCPNCGYHIITKVKPPIAKRVKAV